MPHGLAKPASPSASHLASGHQQYAGMDTSLRKVANSRSVTDIGPTTVSRFTHLRHGLRPMQAQVSLRVAAAMDWLPSASPPTSPLRVRTLEVNRGLRPGRRTVPVLLLVFICGWDMPGNLTNLPAYNYTALW